MTASPSGSFCKQAVPRLTCGISVNLKVDTRCSFYLTRSPSGVSLCRAASAHSGFLRDEGLEAEQEEPLGLGSYRCCDIVGRCMRDCGGSWSSWAELFPRE